MAIIGNEIPPYVQTQITKRQEFHGSGVAKNRTPEQIHYLNSNTSWIKLASGVYVTTNGVGSSLAKNNVLFNGTSMFNGSSLTQKNGFDETYQYSEFGPVPMAGIISADVKALNRGSLKKSTVKIKAHNKDQFDAIDVLYMRIGYTVMLEWGNTFYLDKNGDVQEIHNTLIEDIFFSFSSDGDYTFVLPFIEGKREKYCGNYDALLGRISNFDWAFNPDGSYDITLTILSLGDVVESLKTDISVDSKTTTFLKEARKSNQSISGNSVILEKNKDDNLITSMLWLWTYFNPPPQLAVSTVEGSSTPITNSTLDFTGPGYNPIKSLIFSGESSNYDAMYPGITYKSKFGVTSMSQTIAKVASTATGAVGRYQNMPEFILGRARTSGLDPNTALYNEANQEKMGEGLINDVCGTYIKGTNSGTQPQLIQAVQGLGRGWASIAIVIQGKKVGGRWVDDATVGSVETGAGSKGYYTNSENNYGNLRDGKTVADTVKALMKVRKNLGGSKPDFVPTYINWDTL
jgi:hypothetical protein